MEDVLNHQLYEKMVQKIPPKYDSAAHFIDVHRGLLLEETRSILCSAINNKAELQYCPLVSVEPCESPSLYFIDMNLDMASSESVQCYHIAQDDDVCLLSSEPLIDSSIDEMSCSLAIAVGIGRDISYQKSFRVIVNSEKFQPEEMKYVSFLPNIRFSMEIAYVLSDEKDYTAVKAVLQLYKTVGKECDSCIKLGKGGMQPAVSQKNLPSLKCLHKNQTDVVWAPPGTLKGSVSAILEEFLSLKPKVLVCVRSISSVADIIVDLEELSVSPDTGDVVVINSIMGLKNCSKYEKFCLEHQSQELYCCLTQCKGSLRGMKTLLSLEAYYNTRCSDVGFSCARCKETKLLNFTLKSVTRRFDAIIGLLEECLLYLKNHAASFSLVDQDTTEFEELVVNLKEIEVLLHNEDLRVDYVEKDSLMPAVDGDSGSMAYTLAKSLNERRIRSMTLLDSILGSLHLPQVEDRDMLDRFCIKNSRIVVTTLDCTWQLHGIEMDPFDLMVVHGAGQIREDELLIPFLLPVGHTLLFGDHHHLEPVIKSKLCKEAGHGVSIFEKLQQLVPRMDMLNKQYAMHPFINHFPNTYFYKGNVTDGPNVSSIEYNREYIPLKLQYYAFMDIPAAKVKSIRKGYVYSAAILVLLQRICEDIVNTKGQFSIVVVCMSNTESNTVRGHLKSREELHEKIRLQVTPIDNLKEESFDMIILSMFLEDGTELKCIKENKLNIALTSARHCLWIVGEHKALNSSGGIWKSLIHDAKKRGCIRMMDRDKLSEVTKQFEINDNDRCTNPNSVVSCKTACLPGQELTWYGRPRRTKYILATIRDQRGQTDTCTLQVILGVMESIMKFRNAGLEPPQDFKWDFILDELKTLYEEFLRKPFLSEDKVNRGTKRLENLFQICQKYGVMAINESKTKWRAFKILGWEQVDPQNTKVVKKIIEQGGIMIGHFRVSMNYYNLKPGEVYVYDEDQALLNPRSDQPASHAVMMIGIGHKKIVHNGYFDHMAMQNSEGRIFGFNGIGRVGKDTVRGLYQIKVPETKRPARSGA